MASRKQIMNEPSPVVAEPEPWYVRRLPFKSIPAMLKILAIGIALVFVVRFTHWAAVLFPGTIGFVGTYLFEMWRRKKSGRYLLEVRLQGQEIRNTPQRFTVPASGVRLWLLPQEIYEGALVFGDFRPPMNTGGLIVCDYYDPINNAIVFPDDANWANWTFLTHTNDEIDGYFKEVLSKQKALEKSRNLIAELYYEGRLSPEEAYITLEDIEGEQRKLLKNPKTYRNLFLYYKTTIPWLQHLLMDLQARFEERAHQLGAAYSLMTNGLPLRPELVKALPIERADYDRIKFAAPDYLQEEAVVEDTGIAEEGVGSEGIAQGMHTIGAKKGGRRR